jgi:transposase
MNRHTPISSSPNLYLQGGRPRRGTYLPPYSPDLNPIELSFSALKAFLRKFAERTEDALCRRIGRFVRQLQPEACANFFTHDGYAPT